MQVHSWSLLKEADFSAASRHSSADSFGGGGRAALTNRPLTFAELRQQPRFGEAPGPLDGALRNAQHFGDFAVFQTSEEAQLDDLGFGGVLKGEPIERLVY